MQYEQLPNGLFMPQTLALKAHTARINQERLHPNALTPNRLEQIFVDAQLGSLSEIEALYNVMEERDGHLLSVIVKRRQRVCALDYSIEPQDQASKKQQAAAQTLERLLGSIPNMSSALFDLSDAIGKGVSALEIEWHRSGGYWLPRALHARPLGMFKIERAMAEPARMLADSLRIDDNTPRGLGLQQYGWLVHKSAARTGDMTQSALYRACLWPFLYRSFALGDWLEFLEVYGYPIRIGTYRSGASAEERSSLMRAVIDIGRRAGGIVPEGSEIKLLDATDGDPEAFSRLIEWCDKTQSKLIEGGTLTSQADGKTSTNALGNVHQQQSQILRNADARALQETLNRQLLWPMAILNGLADDLSQCPVWQFDTQEPEDLALYAEAIPKLVAIGAQIPQKWLHEKLRIPAPESGESVLAAPMQTPAPGNAALSAFSPPSLSMGSSCPCCTRLNDFNDRLTAASGVAKEAQKPQNAEIPSADDLLPDLQSAADAEVKGWISALSAMVESAEKSGEPMAQLQEKLLNAFGHLPTEAFVKVNEAGYALAALKGMDDVWGGK